jgi:oligopeptide transport system substrate-binding protein
MSRHNLFFRTIHRLAAGVLLVTFFTACHRRETAVQFGNREQILQLGNATEPADLDPQIISSQQDFNIVLSLEEGLTTPDPKDLHPTPGAAQSWDISPDQTVYTFHLRPNARWSDGSPVTANDFVYSFHRMLSPALASEYSYMLFVMRNAEAFNTGKLTDFSQIGCKALDPLTLQVTLTYSTPYFLSLVGHHSWFPVKQSVIEKWGRMDERNTPWTRPGHYVGNGPFILKVWRTNQIISVVTQKFC